LRTLRLDPIVICNLLAAVREERRAERRRACPLQQT
jgi:hypothetical protein